MICVILKILLSIYFDKGESFDSLGLVLEDKAKTHSKGSML